MEKRQIANIVNFIRAVEPRMEVDLLLPVLKQIELMDKYELSGTFLVQYDTLLDPKFTDVLKKLPSDRYEIGVWLEIVEPLADAIGIEWTGRFPWDWHAHCGFSVGYIPEHRKMIIDELFRKFREVFGYYPRTLGSWAFDAITLDYANEKYGLDAACNCKDQWGTDGYTMWGGYYNQAYYPSKNNSFCPGGEDDQIDVPVFRMLGSDPILQYDFGLDVDGDTSRAQSVITLEPVYVGKEGGGGIPEWIDWYLKENFSGNCLTFGYTQAGQENSFSWPAMERGLCYQFPKLAELQKQGKIIVEKLGDSGKWFKSQFEQTPPSTIVAPNDWNESGKGSWWYNCKNYRANIYAENGKLWIRDIYLFRSDRKEIYIDGITTNNDLKYDNLPLVDGNSFSGNGVRSGLYPMFNGEALTYDNAEYSERDGKAVVTFTGTQCGTVEFVFSEDRIEITATNGNITLINKYDAQCSRIPSKDLVDNHTLKLNKDGYTYVVTLADGEFEDIDTFRAGDNKITIITNER